MRFPDRWFQARFDRAGDFEPEARELAFRHVTKWSCAVDGGAHCGIWTRHLVKRFDAVHAFEPCPANFCYLHDNINAPNAVLHHTALGASHGSARMKPGPMRDPNQNSGQWHLAAGDEVSVVALDDYGLDVGLLKLDVEGYEYFALKGAEQTINRCRPVIVVEENGLCERYGVKRGQCFDLLDSWGYRRVGQCNKDHVFASR